MKKIFLLTLFTTIFSSCQKTEKMKDKLFPTRPYEEAKIDKFYWASEGWDYSMIPLIKPFQLLKLQGSEEWGLSTGFNKYNEIGITPIHNVNIVDNYIYGYKDMEVRDFGDRKINIPQFWFIIDISKGTKDSALFKYDKESDFKTELKKLNLPEVFLNPDEVYERYKENHVLPWFPVEIREQLEEVKSSQRKQ